MNDLREKIIEFNFIIRKTFGLLSKEERISDCKEFICFCEENKGVTLPKQEQEELNSLKEFCKKEIGRSLTKEINHEYSSHRH